jgi:glycosyltransferase involved in cell wall biosynthesis
MLRAPSAMAPRCGPAAVWCRLVSSGRMLPRTRVLYVIPSLAQGGAERHVVELARNLDAERFEVAICVVRPGIHYARELPAGEPRFALGRRLFSPLAFRGVVEVIRRFEPHVLHAHLNDGNLLARLATRFAKVPALVTSVHLDEMGWFYRLAERALWRRSDRIVGVSRGVGDFLVRTLGLPASRVQVIVNGVDPTLFVPGTDAQKAAAREQFGVPAGAVAALMPARISWQKNQDLVVEALGRLKVAGKLPAGFQLLLAGRTSSQKLSRKLDRLIARYDLGAHVRLLGVVKEMQALYWASNLVLMPSRTEGSSLAAFESMSAGLPILISDRGNTDGAVLHDENGWEVPANDLPALERALERALTDAPGTHARLGVAGRRRVEEKFTARRVARDFEALYHSLTPGSPKCSPSIS